MSKKKNNGYAPFDFKIKQPNNTYLIEGIKGDRPMYGETLDKPIDFTKKKKKYRAIPLKSDMDVFKVYSVYEVDEDNRLIMATAEKVTIDANDDLREIF